MAVVVVSQAWTLDAGAHAEAYLQLQREFLAFMRQHPGFRGRRLLRSLEDPTHFTHLRFFESIADYEALTRLPGYLDHIAAMGAHLKRYQQQPREYMEVVLDDPA